MLVFFWCVSLPDKYGYISPLFCCFQTWAVIWPGMAVYFSRLKIHLCCWCLNFWTYTLKNEPLSIYVLMLANGAGYRRWFVSVSALSGGALLSLFPVWLLRRGNRSKAEVVSTQDMFMVYNISLKRADYWFIAHMSAYRWMLSTMFEANQNKPCS